jgi:hypothetical protein
MGFLDDGIELSEIEMRQMSTGSVV